MATLGNAAVPGAVVTEKVYVGACECGFRVWRLEARTFCDSIELPSNAGRHPEARRGCCFDDDALPIYERTTMRFAPLRMPQGTMAPPVGNITSMPWRKKWN